MRIGYVRTSTDKQYTDRQIRALHKYCDLVFVEDGTSARAKEKPVLNHVLGQMKIGYELVVDAFDRAFRDVVEAITTLDFLIERKAKLVSLTQGFDPETTYGRFLYILLVNVAEYEVNNLSDRTKQGLMAAIERGVSLGRPKKGEKRERKHPRKIKPEPLELPGVIYGAN